MFATGTEQGVPETTAPISVGSCTVRLQGGDRPSI